MMASIVGARKKVVISPEKAKTVNNIDTKSHKKIKTKQN